MILYIPSILYTGVAGTHGVYNNRADRELR